MRLNIDDETESLSVFSETAGFEALIRIVDTMVKEGPEADVLKYNLSLGSEGLLIAKAQAEGARKTYRYLQELRSKLKRQQ